QGADGAQGQDGAQGPKGDNGGHYTPSVDTSGNLTWTASESGMPGVSGANIKGPQGGQGDTGPQAPTGDTGPQGETGPAGQNATINGVNVLTLNATGGITGSQSGNTYTLDGSGKQDKLTGSQGQVVGFSENGTAVPVDVV